MTKAITRKDVASFSRLTGLDEAAVREELLARGHLELLDDDEGPTVVFGAGDAVEQDIEFQTRGETVAYPTPTAPSGTPLSAAPRVVRATSDVVVNGRRRVSLKPGGPECWVPDRDLAPRVVLGKSESGGWLTRKIGPLPVYGWGLLGLGAACAYLYWRRS